MNLKKLSPGFLFSMIEGLIKLYRVLNNKLLPGTKGIPQNIAQRIRLSLLTDSEVGSFGS